MCEATNLNPTIVETLYGEALVLADEARAGFEAAGRFSGTSHADDLGRIALSCETLRTTTRMMHAIAWLLNQRAYFAGELSETQLRRHGRLPAPQPEPDPAQLMLLPADLCDLIGRTQAFYARIERLDQAWQPQFEGFTAVHQLHDRLGQAFASL